MPLLTCRPRLLYDQAVRPASAPPRSRGLAGLARTLRALVLCGTAGIAVGLPLLPQACEGTHRVSLTEGRRLPAGMYLLALTQGARRAVTRAVVVRSFHSL